jgi:hypothetical protein
MSRFEGDIGNEVLLRKPFGPDTLAEAVRTALQQVVKSEMKNVVPLRRGDLS